MSANHQLGGAIGTANNIASIRLGAVRRGRSSGQRGGTLLEFAFILVIALALIFGIIDFARALYSYHFVAEAAREATRFASVRGPDCSTSVTPCPAAPADIQNFVQQIVPAGIDPNKVNVPPPVYPSNGEPICSGNPYPGCPVRVTVSYTYSFLFPATFYSLGPSFTMSSTSQLIMSR